MTEYWEEELGLLEKHTDLFLLTKKLIKAVSKKGRFSFSGVSKELWPQF